MIVRNRRKRESLLGRISRSFSRVKPPAGHNSVLSTEQFQQEIDKEIHRSNRRNQNPEFAIISLDFCDHSVRDTMLDFLIAEFKERVRVSDSIGWHEMKLAILLPETGHEGSMLVCNSLLEIARESKVEMDASVSIYPWDDLLHGPFNPKTHSLEKGSNGSDSNWVKQSVKADAFESSPGSFESNSGGVATLAPPVKNTTVVQPPVALNPVGAGTGMRLSFAQTESTPLWKRTIDIAGAGVGLMLLSPVLLGAAAAIKLTSQGPVFFRQQREGKDGSVFNILKFRTMCVDAEEQKDELRKLSEQDGPAFKLKDDPRITRIGKYLRKSCIDELPQLFNVLTGEMSLVGPRPLPVNESQQCLPWQRQRLTVLPGLTCTWQARGGRDIKFAEWMRMDLEYIQQRGFWSDIRLIGETAMVVVMHKGSV